MNKGKVSFYNSAKDYGFITDMETMKEYYVHAVVLRNEIRTNDEVSFELQKRDTGFIAIDVRLANLKEAQNSI